jgi:RNA polymerase sigma-70 factor (ECF subfamily)
MAREAGAKVTVAAATTATDARGDVGAVFAQHRRFLWGLAYRLTGNAADADDVVQETFVRALRRPPADRARPWRPWLVRVALNLGRDLLRGRRRRGYEGPWLPSPVEAEPPSHEPVDLAGDPAARYDLVESVSFAFLLALEALSPRQRATLLLRDVFDYSVRETARALALSEANVRAVHMRARRALAAYDAARRPLSAARQAAEGETLQRFLAAVTAGDVAGVESMLADDVRAVSDAAGEFHAARVPVLGRRKVAALMVGVAQGLGALRRAEVRLFNGLPAFLAEATVRPGFAPRFVLQLELDGQGRIREVRTVLATRKLTGVTWDRAAEPRPPR